MLTRDYRDVLAGGLLFAVGAYAAIHAGQNYSLGTLRHMGPGMFPWGLGFLLMGLGALIGIPAFLRSGPRIGQFEFRPFIWVCAAVLTFALLIRNFGVIPAMLLMTVVASFSDGKLGFLKSIILGSFLAALAVGIFIYGLGMPLQLVTVPYFRSW